VVPPEDPPGPFPPSLLQPTPTAMHSAKKARRRGELRNGLVCDMGGFLLIKTIKKSILGEACCPSPRHDARRVNRSVGSAAKLSKTIRLSPW